MQKFDITLFYSTVDSPGGPAYATKSTDDDADAQYYNDEAATSDGARLGQLIGSIILLSGFLYCWFAL